MDKKEQAKAPEIRPVRTVVVEPQRIDADRQVVGEVKPRYESDLSFRVAGKVLVRRVDVGASVKQGDTLAALDTQDFQNRLRSAEADVASAEAELVETQGNEARKAKLLKDGFTPQATYDTALRNLRSAEARRASAKANLDLTRDQLRYTELKADFDGVITAVGAEPGQNVNAGQMVVKLARPDDKDAVFSIAETAFTGQHPTSEHAEVIVWPLSNPELQIEGVAREISPVADSDHTHLHGQSHAQESAAAAPLRHEYRWPLESDILVPSSRSPCQLSSSRTASPAVWVVDERSGSVALRPVTVARYETDASSSLTGSRRETSSSLPAPTRCAKARRSALRRPR